MWSVLEEGYAGSGWDAKFAQTVAGRGDVAGFTPSPRWESQFGRPYEISKTTHWKISSLLSFLIQTHMCLRTAK